MRLSSYDATWCTERNATTFVIVSHILRDWGQFFVHHNNIWQSIPVITITVYHNNVWCWHAPMSFTDACWGNMDNFHTILLTVSDILLRKTQHGNGNNIHIACPHLPHVTSSIKQKRGLLRYGSILLYSLSNVIPVDEKFTALHQYPRYCHKSVTILFSIPGAISWA